jgi:phosphoglucomutase
MTTKSSDTTPSIEPSVTPIPARGEILDSLSGLILSASGWRKVFAADGADESRCTSLSRTDQLLVAAMALTFARTVESSCTVAVATDSRPTGPLIADIIIRVLLASGCRVRFSGVTAIPELLSAVQLDDAVSGFAYVSASHNPIGHNGLKLGYADGAVAGGREAADLISSFRAIVETEDFMTISQLVTQVDGSMLQQVYADAPSWKQETFKYYSRFTRALSAGGVGSPDSFNATLRDSATRHPIGVIGELNGSARATTIDRQVLEDAGVTVHLLNDTPGQIVHRIVPEGASLDLCRETLERMHTSEPAYSIGYVPDNDGDRGNLVYVGRDGTARPLQAQAVFALSCLSELAFLSYLRSKNGLSQTLDDTVVVANGPTSMRVDRIAAFFGARVELAEVGEANVVGLARELRETGLTVRFLGEGSNGGNITHPAACRDPLNTLFSILKLMLIRGEPDRPGLFEIWCETSSQRHLYRKDFVLEDIVESIPHFVTTSAYEDRAIMRISATNHARLKAEYETAFQESWPEMQEYLERELGVHRWTAINYEGTKASVGVGNRDLEGPQKGGLKILLEGPGGERIAYLWMRGSGTEPVFRILVDVAGECPDIEERLLSWQRELIGRADRIASGP